MKKIFYLLFLINLCFIFNFEIKAEEIDCNSQPYACVKCTYDLPFNNSSVTFVAYSDGNYVKTLKYENINAGNVANTTYNYSASNFEDKGNNKLTCLTLLYYSSSQSGTSTYMRDYRFSFVAENNNLNNVKLTKEENNGKQIYSSNQNQVKSCNYKGSSGYYYNINIISDGKNIWYDDSNSEYKVYKTEGLIADLFLDDYDNLKEECPTFYFACSNSGQLGKICSITTKENGTAGNGNENLDSSEVEAFTKFLNGSRYKELLGSLKTPLSSYASGALSIPLTIDGNKNATLNDVDANNLLCSGGECSTNGKYYTEQGLRNIRQYCNELYSNYEKYKGESDSLKKRMDECVDFFNGFYNELINQGIIENLSNYCGVLSQDFAAKLKYFLNIIKIAGPLLALGLGTVDFVKVLANGDADKEMKNAFKRFLTRLGAAALLFLVPIILAFLLDLFMKPGLGYDSNNPFCDIVDWNG